MSDLIPGLAFFLIILTPTSIVLLACMLFSHVLRLTSGWPLLIVNLPTLVLLVWQCVSDFILDPTVSLVITPSILVLLIYITDGESLSYTILLSSFLLAFRLWVIAWRVHWMYHFLLSCLPFPSCWLDRGWVISLQIRLCPLSWSSELTFFLDGKWFNFKARYALFYSPFSLILLVRV